MEVEVGMVRVWAWVVGGVGTDRGLVCEGCADVEGGGGLVCVCGGVVWVYVLNTGWAFCVGEGGGDWCLGLMGTKGAGGLRDVLG